MSSNGNGDINEIGEMATAHAEEESFKGSRLPIGEIERQDGLIADAASKLGKANIGVLLRAMSAFDSDKDYRQILKMGNWRTREKARQAVKAIDECRLIGYEDGIKAILDDITAQSGGENMALLFKVFETLTHTTFTTNSTANRKWWQGKNDNRSQSPIP